MISVLILTKNEQQDLPGCLESVIWCDDVHLFDSFSTDETVNIAKKFGAKITQRVFDNWSAHQNWGLENIKFKYPWVLYIDADERVSESLIKSLQQFDFTNEDSSAFEIQRRDFFADGKWLKYTQISPFYIRLFRPEKIKYERLVNPLTIVDGTVKRFSGYLNHYPFSKGIRFWMSRHLGYADMEALTRFADLEKGVKFSLKKALFSSDFTEKRFHQKGLFYKMPLRPLIKWLYMVVYRRGFLDGKSGITYAFLQAIYEYLIVLRTRELKAKQNSQIG